MPTWNYETVPSRAHPLGATPDENGVHFSVFSLNATSIELLLFDPKDDVPRVAAARFLLRLLELK